MNNNSNLIIPKNLINNSTQNLNIVKPVNSIKNPNLINNNQNIRIIPNPVNKYFNSNILILSSIFLFVIIIFIIIYFTVFSKKSKDNKENTDNVSSDEENIPSDEENIPLDEENVSSDEENVPSDEENIPLDEENVPSDEENVPSNKKISNFPDNIIDKECKFLNSENDLFTEINIKNGYLTKFCCDNDKPCDCSGLIYAKCLKASDNNIYKTKIFDFILNNFKNAEKGNHDLQLQFVRNFYNIQPNDMKMKIRDNIINLNSIFEITSYVNNLRNSNKFPDVNISKEFI